MSQRGHRLPIVYRHRSGPSHARPLPPERCDLYVLEPLEPRVLLTTSVPAFDEGTVEVMDYGDGRILIAATPAGAVPNANDSLVVFRLTANGALDSTFGEGGIARLHGSYFLDQMELQPDGKILILGDVWDADSRLAVFRLDADGTPDPTFGQDGRVALPTPPSGSVSVGQGMIDVLPDGRILAAEIGNVRADTDLVLARYTADGQPDRTFGDDGVALAKTPVSPYSVSLSHDDGDDAIHVTMTTLDSPTVDLMLARFHPDGSPDVSYGVGGIVPMSLGGYYRYLAGTFSDGRLLVSDAFNRDLLIYSPDGLAELSKIDLKSNPSSLLLMPRPTGQRLVLAVNPLKWGEGGVAEIVALTTGGAPDPTFADGGHRVIGTDREDMAGALQLAPAADGGLIAVHTGMPRPYWDYRIPGQIVIDRFDADGQPIQSFGTAGRATFTFEEPPLAPYVYDPEPDAWVSRPVDPPPSDEPVAIDDLPPVAPDDPDPDDDDTVIEGAGAWPITLSFLSSDADVADLARVLDKPPERLLLGSESNELFGE